MNFLQVVDKLKSIYGDLYTNDNVLISGIHTHSGPAGYFQYVLFEVSSNVHVALCNDCDGTLYRWSLL